MANIANCSFEILTEDSRLLTDPIKKGSQSSDFIEVEYDVTIDDLDKTDYLIAAASGALTAAIDILWVKDFNLLEAQNWGREKIDNFVVEVAKKNGYKGDDPQGAIERLEKSFTFKGKKHQNDFIDDKAKDDFSGGLLHHLNDFSHHPTILGLSFSLLSQFTGYAFGTNKNGSFYWVKIKGYKPNDYDVPQKLFNGTVKWVFHLISDVAGSSGSRGLPNNYGMGIPGPILSLLKEISSLPLVKDIPIKYKGSNTEFYKIVQKLYEGAFFKHDSLKDVVHFDLRTELGIAVGLTKQALPVIANEMIIRVFYSVRRLYMEIKENDIQKLSDLKNLDYKRIMPIKNRTVIRMATVSSGTFFAIVSANAAIRAIYKNQGLNIGFAKDFLIRLNYPGVIRFALACKADAKYISEDILLACQNFMEKHNTQYIEKERELKPIKKAIVKYRGVISNTPEKFVIGAGVTVAATALTGGLAFAFAPEIAILLAGESVAGLSGAALTSASLAFVGGGSLAAGGLGMAGGTAIIVGGGALFGTAASGTASAVLSKASKDETLDQCAQMLAYCKCILLDQQHSIDAIKDIKNRVVEEIVARTQAIAEFEPKSKEDKRQLKEQETCLEYIKRCNKELGKLIKLPEKVK